MGSIPIRKSTAIFDVFVVHRPTKIAEVDEMGRLLLYAARQWFFRGKPKKIGRPLGKTAARNEGLFLRANNREAYASRSPFYWSLELGDFW